MLVPSTKLIMFLEGAFSPEEVAVRKFTEFKHKNYGSQIRPDNKIDRAQITMDDINSQ